MYSESIDTKLEGELARSQISLLDFHILDDLFTFFPMPQPQLESRVTQTVSELAIHKRCDVGTISTRILHLQERAYICEISSSLLIAIKEIVTAAGFSIASTSLPAIGDFDLTLAGASLMMSVSASAFSDAIGESHVVRVAIDSEGMGFLYSNFETDLRTFSETVYDFEVLGQVMPRGPWIDRWWRVFPRGFEQKVRLKSEICRKD